MDNVILDSDIILNTKHKWSTNVSGDSYDVQSVATHELGHSLHLGDLYGSDDTEKTMYAHGSGKIGQRHFIRMTLMELPICIPQIIYHIQVRYPYLYMTSTIVQLHMNR